MTGPRDTGRDDDICGACQIGECGYCHGNVSLDVGPGPAVPLLQCMHRCPSGRIRAAGKRAYQRLADPVVEPEASHQNMEGR